MGVAKWVWPAGAEVGRVNVADDGGTEEAREYRKASTFVGLRKSARDLSAGKVTSGGDDGGV